MIQVNHPQSVCRFGLASRDITPPVGIYHRMWGAATHDRSAGVHRPLRATACVFASSTKPADQQTVVAVDHCLLYRREMEFVLDRILPTIPVDRDRLLIAFSHTHAAGLMGLDRTELPGGELIEPYLETLAREIASAVNEALGALEPVTISYATGRCSLATHRDFWDEANGLYVCGYNPAQAADDTVLVARVTGPDDRLRATFVNYACHPTTLAWDNELISPDYPGAMREVIEAATGAPCVFLQGASGDLGPRDGYVGDTAVADRNGRQLGYAALSALESTLPPQTALTYCGPVVSGATIGVWEPQPLTTEQVEAKQGWQQRRWTVELPYRAGLPDVASLRRDRDESLERERAATAKGELAASREARAMAERYTRQIARLSHMPPGDCLAYPITAWRMGDAIWVAVAGEPYNLLQRELRKRFAPAPVVVMALSGDWSPGYLPTKDVYGTGIYQESIAIVEKGSLERVIDAAAEQVEPWLTGRIG